MASITLELAEAQEFIIGQAAAVEEKPVDEFVEDVLMRAACETLAPPHRSLIKTVRESRKDVGEALARLLPRWDGRPETLPTETRADLLQQVDHHIAAIRKLQQRQREWREVQRQVDAILAGREE